MAANADMCARIDRQLVRIEDEMKRIGYWSDGPAAPPTATHEGDSAIDPHVRSFEGWLQYVFLPQARLANANATVRADFHVGVLAMRAYAGHSLVPEAQELFRLLSEFDALVRAAASATAR